MTAGCMWLLCYCAFAPAGEFSTVTSWHWIEQPFKDLFSTERPSWYLQYIMEEVCNVFNFLELKWANLKHLKQFINCFRFSSPWSEYEKPRWEKLLLFKISHKKQRLEKNKNKTWIQIHHLTTPLIHHVTLWREPIPIIPLD